MANAIAERQAPAFPTPSDGAFSPPPASSPDPTPATSATSAFDYLDPSQSSSQSWVETVILIAPSGTVGGSIIISSVLEPQPTPLTFSTPGPGVSLPSLSDILSSQPLPTLTHPSTRPHHFSFTQTPLSDPPTSISTHHQLSSSSHHVSSTLSSLITTTKSTSTSVTTSSTSSSLPSTTSHSISTSQTSASQQSVTSTPDPPVRTKPAGLGAGGIAAVSISMGGLALLLGLALLYFCHRRRQNRPVQVYPEEAYLYDPPMDVINGPVETTEYRRAGDTGSVYGVQGQSLVSAGLVRAATPDVSSSPEREGLLSRARRGSRPRTASSSLMNTGVGGTAGVPGAMVEIPPTLPTMRGILSPISLRGYEAAPTEETEEREAELADRELHQPQEYQFEEDNYQDNPFDDPPDTSYNGGALVVQNPDIEHS